MVVDGLSKLMIRVEQCNMVEGFSVGGEMVPMSHLQFADTIFFHLWR